MVLTEKDLRAIGELISEKFRGEVPRLIKAEIEILPTREEVKALIRAEIEDLVPPLIKAENLGLATSAEVRKLAEIVSGMTTNEVTAANQDQVMGELQAIRQEHAMLNNRVREHEDRITDLEKIHPGGSHAS